MKNITIFLFLMVINSVGISQLPNCIVVEANNQNIKSDLDYSFSENYLYLYKMEYSDSINGDLIYELVSIDSISTDSSSNPVVIVFIQYPLTKSQFLVQSGPDNFGDPSPIYALRYGNYKIELLGYPSSLLECEVCVKSEVPKIGLFYLLLKSKNFLK